MTPELRFVDGAVFLGPLKGRASAAAVLILCDITHRSPKCDCATPARGNADAYLSVMSMDSTRMGCAPVTGG